MKTNNDGTAKPFAEAPLLGRRVVTMFGIRTADRDWGAAGRDAARRLIDALNEDYPTNEVDRADAGKFRHLLR